MYLEKNWPNLKLTEELKSLTTQCSSMIVFVTLLANMSNKFCY